METKTRKKMVIDLRAPIDTPTDRTIGRLLIGEGILIAASNS